MPPKQKPGPAFWTGFFRQLFALPSGLQLWLAAQLSPSVTATGASTVVRFRDLAIVLGHVTSLIGNSWLLKRCGNLVGKPSIAKRTGDLKRRLLVTSSLGLPTGGIEPILQTSQDFGFRIFGGRVGLSQLDGGVSGLLLIVEIVQLRLQIVAVLANLPESFGVQPPGLAALLLNLAQAREHGLNGSGRFVNLRRDLQTPCERLQRGVAAMLANAQQCGQPR